MGNGFVKVKIVSSKISLEEMAISIGEFLGFTGIKTAHSESQPNVRFCSAIESLKKGSELTTNPDYIVTQQIEFRNGNPCLTEEYQIQISVNAYNSRPQSKCLSEF